MERESFESAEIGDLLNKHFVSIKVDREERPDIDKLYMSFVQVRQSGLTKRVLKLGYIEFVMASVMHSAIVMPPGQLLLTRRVNNI